MRNDVGRSIKELSDFPCEDEWLLPPGTRMRIVDVVEQELEFDGYKAMGWKITLELITKT